MRGTMLSRSCWRARGRLRSRERRRSPEMRAGVRGRASSRRCWHARGRSMPRPRCRGHEPGVRATGSDQAIAVKTMKYMPRRKLSSGGVAWPPGFLVAAFVALPCVAMRLLLQRRRPLISRRHRPRGGRGSAGGRRPRPKTRCTEERPRNVGRGAAGSRERNSRSRGRGRWSCRSVMFTTRRHHAAIG